MAPDHMIAADAAALFASDLSSRCRPSQATTVAAIRTAISAYGGVRGCLGALAAAYGEHPEAAVPRMRWALETIEGIYPQAAPSAMATPAAPGPVLGLDQEEGANRVVRSIARCL